MKQTAYDIFYSLLIGVLLLNILSLRTKVQNLQIRYNIISSFYLKDVRLAGENQRIIWRENFNVLDLYVTIATDDMTIGAVGCFNNSGIGIANPETYIKEEKHSYPFVVLIGENMKKGNEVIFNKHGILVNNTEENRKKWEAWLSDKNGE